MKFLCLPGAYGSAKNFQVQLGPLVDESEKRNILQFKWTQGKHSAVPPPGFEDYFGAGPLFRFIEYDGLKAFDLVEKIRDFPEGKSAEDTMRELLGDDSQGTIASIGSALEDLLDTIDKDPEIEGILGYSEGASTAASLILHERQRRERDGRPRRIKRAIFLAGWPPLSMEDGNVRILLADESADVIDIPTLHIVGGNDPYIQGAMALYNMCDEDTAELFDHGKGHTVPRDARTVQELGDAMVRLVEKKEQWAHESLLATEMLDDNLAAVKRKTADSGGGVFALSLPVAS